MKPTLRLQATKLRAEAALPDNTRDVSGLTEQRQQAIRALEETRESRRTGEIEQAAVKVVEQLEQGLTGAPEIGPAGFVTARVIASGDSKARQPAVPLAGLTARLKVNEEIIEEKETNRFGLVTLELPKKEGGSYEIEILGSNCNVIACQKGQWEPSRPPASHRIEMARSEELKPQLERSVMFEEAIRKARERADIARDVIIKALDAQEQKLIEYLSEIDEELKRDPDQEIKLREQAPQQLAPVVPVELVPPKEEKPKPEETPKLEEKPKSEERPKAEEKPKPEEKSTPEEKPKPEERPKPEGKSKTETNLQKKDSDTKQRSTDKEKKSK